MHKNIERRVVTALKIVNGQTDRADRALRQAAHLSPATALITFAVGHLAFYWCQAPTSATENKFIISFKPAKI